MTAVIYARYSSDSQREASIEGQLRDCNGCIRHKLELTGESVVWSLLDETVLFSIYKVIELYFENKKGPLHFCEMALRKYSVFTK